MKKLLIPILILTFLNACAQNKPLKTKQFIPDTTINRALKLLHSKSVEQSIGDQKGKLILDEQESRIQLENANKNEYLILYHLAGSNANSFNKFEVGLLKGKKKLYQPIKFEFFASESGIRTGIGLKELVKIKGRNYNKTRKNDFVIISYKIANAKSSFLKNYNMPLYTAKYYFKDDKLEKFIFGFPNL